MSDKSDNKSKKTWRAEFNTETCSLCEMCVNRCPTQALYVQKSGDKLAFLFDHRLCDACRGKMYCEFHCPEKAVTVTRVPAKDLPAEPVILISGEMATCKDCGNQFMPERKLAALLEQEKITPKSVQSFCPECRRKHILNSYLDNTDQG